jgi:hypothetical protein
MKVGFIVALIVLSPEGKVLMTLGTAGVPGRGPNTFNEPNAIDRISQLKSQAILRLRSYMEERWPVERGAQVCGPWNRCLCAMSGETLLNGTAPV